MDLSGPNFLGPNIVYTPTNFARWPNKVRGNFTGSTTLPDPLYYAFLCVLLRRMLTRDLFAIANIVDLSCGKAYKQTYEA